MKRSFAVVVALFAVACGGGLDGAAGSGTGGATAGAASGSGGSDAAASGGSGGDQCAALAVPSEAHSLSLTFPFEVIAVPTSVDGYVFVEGSAPGELDLVSEAGQRMAIGISPPNAALTGLPIGSRLWFSGYALAEQPVPWVYRRGVHFALRTDERGPLLLAAIEDMLLSGDTLLGIPLDVRSRCTALSVLDQRSPSTGELCTISTEYFEVAISSDPPVTLAPGSVATVAIGGDAYDLALLSGEDKTYPDPSCQPNDSQRALSLQFTLVAEDLAGLLANQPVFAESLPACRMGTDTPPFQLDSASLNWSALSAPPSDSPMSIYGSDADSVTFALPNLGMLTARGLSMQGRAMLERARWFSWVAYSQYVIRDGDGGRVLALESAGALSKLSALAEGVDVLGLQMSAEPRCDWIPAACSSQGASLFDVVYADRPGHRVPSQQRTTVTSAAGSYDAWVGVEPSCGLDPFVSAAFLATE